MSLAIRENHALITSGVYRRIRKDPYSLRDSCSYPLVVTCLFTRRGYQTCVDPDHARVGTKYLTERSGAGDEKETRFA